ncbi:MAG TPA: HD domain-containing phosphohydrolase [Actinomycetota bacterium]|nr:HD domain-containing phosphohydrolase [Actinomycetota bacterium]
MSDPAAALRLAELLAPLSLVMDLGRGQPPEESMQACLLAVGLGRSLELPEADVAVVFYASLLRHLGCTASSHEESLALGDELAMRPVLNRTDFTRPAEVLAAMGAARRRLGIGAVARMATSFGGARGNRIPTSICEVGRQMAERLDMETPVADGVHQAFERWDGKGVPQGLRGEDISLAARLSSVASQAVAAFHAGGPEAAVERVADKSGSWFDPAIGEEFRRHGATLLAELAASDCLDAVFEAEPHPRRWYPPERHGAVARAFADMVDLKTPFLHGHSPRVATLAAGAAHHLGLGVEGAARLELAGLFHDLGRVAVPGGTWERAGPLTSTDWERVRLHPYHSERILSRVPALAHLAPLAGGHHERLDGSGYHRQVTGAALTTETCVLAAADVFAGMTADRPHRPAHHQEEAAAELRRLAAGQLDLDAVRAVLEAAGQPAPPPRPPPAGLSEREIEVLRLIAGGLSNREIGHRLFISPRTAEHHVQHVYTKIGLSTRAGAAMFAMQHDLVR